MVLDSSPQSIAKIVEILKNNGVVIIPADTVYGFFARVQAKEAIERIYEIKKRERRKPFAVYTTKREVSDLVVSNDIAEKLIDKFWPGNALAMLLPKRPEVPDWFSEGVDTLCVMTANNAVMRQVLSSMDGALVGTTVNLSGEPEMRFGEETLEFENDVDAILINDDMPVFGKPSTIVDCSVKPPAIVRLSAIPFPTVQEVLPDLELHLERRIK